ncbi:MAG: hypothetical protein ACXQS2_02500, partial [Methermicoccaceae archaeon]
MNLRHTFFTLGIDPKKYAKKVAVPMVLLGIVAGIAIKLLLPDKLIFQSFSIVVPLFSVVMVLLYPTLRIGKRANEINTNMHYFITEMGTLATSDLTRMSLFETLASNEKYGALGDEAEKIFRLMA